MNTHNQVSQSPSREHSPTRGLFCQRSFEFVTLIGRGETQRVKNEIKALFDEDKALKADLAIMPENRRKKSYAWLARMTDIVQEEFLCILDMAQLAEGATPGDKTRDGMIVVNVNPTGRVLLRTDFNQVGRDGQLDGLGPFGLTSQNAALYLAKEHTIYGHTARHCNSEIRLPTRDELKLIAQTLHPSVRASLRSTWTSEQVNQYVGYAINLNNPDAAPYLANEHEIKSVCFVRTVQLPVALEA